MNLSITLASTDLEQHQDKEEDRMLDIDVHSFLALDLMKNINISGGIETEASLGLIFKGKCFYLFFINICFVFIYFLLLCFVFIYLFICRGI